MKLSTFFFSLSFFMLLTTTISSVFSMEPTACPHYSEEQKYNFLSDILAVTFRQLSFIKMKTDETIECLTELLHLNEDLYSKLTSSKSLMRKMDRIPLDHSTLDLHCTLKHAIEILKLHSCDFNIFYRDLPSLFEIIETNFNDFLKNVPEQYQLNLNDRINKHREQIDVLNIIKKEISIRAQFLPKENNKTS
jgi:hypothetical protein